MDCVGRLFAFIYDIVCVSDCDLGAGRRGEEQGVIGRCYALICQGVPKGYRVQGNNLVIGLVSAFELGQL